MILWAENETAAAARAVQKLCPGAAAAAIARAEEISRREFLFQDHWEMEPTCQPVRFPDGMVWDAVPAGDPEWTYALNRHTIFVNLGKAWQYTGRSLYRDTFVYLLEDWLRQPALGGLEVRLLGPAPASVVKVNERYRYRLTLACRNTRTARAMVAELLRLALTDRENKGVSVFADVDPLD